MCLTVIDRTDSNCNGSRELSAPAVSAAAASAPGQSMVPPLLVLVVQCHPHYLTNGEWASSKQSDRQRESAGQSALIATVQFVCTVASFDRDRAAAVVHL